jgi:hypothetical protein
MAQTHTWGTTFKSGADSVSVPTETVTASGEAIVDETVAANADGVLHVIHIDVSALKSLMILASKAMTLKSNSDSDPDDTLTLAANQLLRWTSNSGLECPLSADVTSGFYVDNGAAEGTLKIFALQDITP